MFEAEASGENPSDSKDTGHLYDGQVYLLNTERRSGQIEALSSTFRSNRLFHFSCSEEYEEQFECLKVSQKVQFRTRAFGNKTKPVITELVINDGGVSVQIPVTVPANRPHGQPSKPGRGENTRTKNQPNQRSFSRPTNSEDDANQRLYSQLRHNGGRMPNQRTGGQPRGPNPRNDRQQRGPNQRNGGHQHEQQLRNTGLLPTPNQDQNNTGSNGNIQPLLSLELGQNGVPVTASVPQKFAAMTGTVAAVKNLDGDSPYGFIDPDSEFTDGGRNSGVKFDFRNVKPPGVKLKRGDRVKFVLQARNKERLYATKVYIQGLNTQRSDNDIEKMIQKILEKVKAKQTGAQELNDTVDQGSDSDLLINVLGNKEIWKCMGDCPNLSNSSVVLLMALVKEVKAISTGLNTNFKSIIQTISHTNLLSHDGPLASLINEVLSYNDQNCMGKIRNFLLLIADHVPEKIAAVSSLVKPMLSNDKSSLDFFLWRVLKASVRSKDTLAEDQDWDELPLVPSPHEMLQGPQEGAFNLQPAKTNGPYASAEEYIDINFRLLRADCFNALNKGVRALLEGNLDLRDMNAYHSLKLNGIRLSDYDSPLTIALNITPLKPVRNWEKSRNLMYGNLVCISVSGTFQDPIWATVTSRDLLQKTNIVMLEFCSECNSIDDADALNMLQYADSKSVMVESPTYYKSYQPVLQSLQNLEPEKIPFQQEIVDVGQTEKPIFFDENSLLDAGIVYNGATDMNVDEFLGPSPEGMDTTLDISQEVAIKHCLMKRVAIIQGPPGTGKTFIGAKLVQLLNTVSTKPRNPILVLTYKNHALDEFMKEMSNTYPGEIARIGGRATALSQYNLSELKRNTRRQGALYDQTKEYRSDMEKIQALLIEKSQEIKAKMQINFYMFLAYASSEQMVMLLRECNWRQIKLPSMFSSQANPGQFQEVHRRGKHNSQRHVDNKEVDMILRSLQIPLKEFLCSPVHESEQLIKSSLLQMLNVAFFQWLPSMNDFQEVRNSLYTTVSTDFSKLAMCAKEEDDDEDVGEDEEQIRAMEDERMAAIGASKGEKVTLENIIKIGYNMQGQNKNLPSIFPVPKEFSTEVFRSYLQRKTNLWAMEKRERVLYIQNMLHLEFTSAQTQFKELLTKYKTIHKCKAELDIMHSVGILREKKVIGMTITGASIHCDLISQLKPEIIIVEEAAEVMEPQILSTLGEWVQQLILIGDQKQLRPNVESFEMRKYNLDVSLMERLINNDLDYSKLQLQNRMRPEFAEMLKDIYPGLRSNLDRVGKNQKPESATKAMYFWTHTFPEIGATNEAQIASKKTKELQALGRSYRNEEEAERCIQLALFFIQQGYLPCQITILAAYLGQVHLLRSKMRQARKTHEKLFDANSIAQHDEDFDPRYTVIQTIDNYQGDENEIVIVSLVRSNAKGKTGFLNTLNRRCVSQSRAKCGMYFIGDDSTIESSKHWQPLLESMREQNCLGPCIPLQCPDHADVQITPRNAKDITLQPFCTKTCTVEMACGLHSCDSLCQPRHDHKKCTKMVRFTFKPCGHPGIRSCYENEYDKRCSVTIDFTFPCTHLGTRLCHENEKAMLCKTEVTHTFPCKHTMKKKCHEDMTHRKCKTKVMFDFPCGHTSSKLCGEDHSRRKCDEVVLFAFPCDHTDTKLCHEDETLKSCQQKVEFTLPCGHRGRRICHQPEDIVKCKEKCTKILPKCGHICSGTCSQPCNADACKECRRIAEELERQRREEEQRKRDEIQRQVNVEIAVMKSQWQRFHIQELKDNGQSEIEYIRVRDMVLKYIQPMDSWYPKITRIEKIHNSELYLRFLQCKRKLFDPSVCQEKFHGTSAAATRKIAKFGFNVPKARDDLFGQGIYFTSDSSASAQEAYKTGSGTLLLCDVLLGKVFTATSVQRKMNGQKLARNHLDSLYAKRGTDPAVKNDTFVVYNPDQAFPKYIIHYTKNKVVIRPVETFQTETGEKQIAYQMHHLKPKREVDFKDPLEIHFRIVESQFHRLRGKYLKRHLPDIESIEYHISPTLVDKFEAKEKEFEEKHKKRPNHAKSVLAFHGTALQNVHGIVQTNFDMTRIERAIHGFGVYFSEFPDISKAYGEGLLLCRVLPGRSYIEKETRVKEIPQGFDSITVRPDDKGRCEMIVIANPDQILPCYVIHLHKENPADTTPPTTNQTAGSASASHQTKPTASPAAAIADSVPSDTSTLGEDVSTVDENIKEEPDTPGSATNDQNVDEAEASQTVEQEETVQGALSEESATNTTESEKEEAQNQSADTNDDLHESNIVDD